MQFPSPVAITWIADFINATLLGNSNSNVTGINEIHKVEIGDIVFVDHPKYYDTCLNSLASFIIIDKEVTVPIGKTILIVDNPFEAYCKIVNHFNPFYFTKEVINQSAKIGINTFIFPNTFIGNNVSIGDNCIIYPNVCIMDNCKISNNVIIQSGTVIGSDAFYYNNKKNREIWYKKMPSCGNVILEDDVEIGAGCTIDRGISHNTIIGKGTKFDNLIHIGHDTVIGKNCLFAANVVVGGCVTISDGVVAWGGVIINKTLRIGENAVLLGRTGVNVSIAGNKTYWGTPAREAGIVQRELVWIKRIPELWNKIMSK